MKGSRNGSLFRWALLFMGLAGMVENGFGTGQVTVAWDASKDPLVSGYSVYYGRASGQYTTVTQVTDGTSITIGNLTEGSEYYFALTSFYPDGTESDFAPEISYLVPSSVPAGSNSVTYVQGTYAGLISSDAVQSKNSGSIAVTIGSRAAYSGRLRLGGQTCGFMGRLDEQGSTTKTVRLDGESLTLRLRMGTGPEQDQLFGDLTGNSWTAEITGARRAFDATTNRTPSRGVYTMAITPDTSKSGSPEGYGYGLVHVSAGGAIWFSGALADGAKVTQGSVLCAGGLWPVHLPLYRGGGMLMNWLAFTNQAGSDLSGSLAWVRPEMQQAGFYPGGFTNSCPVVASAYKRPSSPATLLQPAQTFAAFSGGDLAQDLLIPLQITSSGAVQDVTSAGVTMRFVPSTGIFHGRLKDPSTDAEWRFDGAVLLNVNSAVGRMLGADKSSRVIINGDH